MLLLLLQPLATALYTSIPRGDSGTRSNISFLKANSSGSKSIIISPRLFHVLTLTMIACTLSV